jgi:hypothetical protein
MDQAPFTWIKSIKHNEDFTPAFTIRADRERELLDALREDIVLRLQVNETNVTAIHDAPDGGFTYKYSSGNSVGSISVQPLAHKGRSVAILCRVDWMT